MFSTVETRSDPSSSSFIRSVLILAPPFASVFTGYNLFRPLRNPISPKSSSLIGVNPS
jgi:hypothetical protein